MGEHKDLDRKVIRLSKQIVQMCTEAGSGHPSSALALVHITAALMYRVMKYDPRDPWNPASDRLVLSEGHVVPVVYAAYCDLGGVVGSQTDPSLLRFEDALTLRAADSVLDGHPNPAIGFPFFDAATGSLGQGVSVAAGLACGAQLDETGRTIYCIVGDGESREGQIWEAMDFIVDHKLTAVRTIFNCNHQAQSDYVSPQQTPEVLTAKLEAFGFEVRAIDGHNWDEIFAALTGPVSDKPIAIVALTVKGWGVKELQDKTCHGKPLPADKVEKALAELDEKAAELGVADMEDTPAVALKAPARLDQAPRPRVISAGAFGQAVKSAGMEKALETRQLSTRKAYGAALAALGGADDRIVALDGDVKNSTFAGIFAKKYPDRYFEGRIAEQNMISAGVGLAAAGKIPFVSSFAKFLVRGYDQIEMAAVSNANLKLCGSHSGVSLAADGPSQMGLPDLAFFRAFARTKQVNGQPACRVMLPSDAVSAFKLTARMANIDGMCYMRTHRPDVPIIYEEDETFEMGGFKHLIDGEDLAIVASGYMVHVCKKAVEILEERAGLSATLIDAYCMPFEADEILRIGDDCRGQILVVEDNYQGGIAAEVAAAAARSDLGVMVTSMFVQSIPKSCKTPEEMLKLVGLSPEDIADAAQGVFDKSE